MVEKLRSRRVIRGNRLRMQSVHGARESRKKCMRAVENPLVGKLLLLLSLLLLLGVLFGR